MIIIYVLLMMYNEFPINSRTIKLLALLIHIPGSRGLYLKLGLNKLGRQFGGSVKKMVSKNRS